MTPSTYEFMEAVVDPHSSKTFDLTLPHELGPFRPTSLDVPKDVAPHFAVVDVKVGGNSQFASSSCVPADVFAPQRRDDDLYFDLVPTTRYLTVTVTNTSKNPQTFRCRVAGVHGYDKVDPRGRGCLLGLGWSIVKPKEVFTLHVQPPMVMAPKRLHLPPEVASHFTITSAEKQSIVSINRMIETSPPVDAVAAEILTRKNLSAGGLGFSLEPNVLLTPNHYLKLVLTNDSAEPRPFTGAVVGRHLT